AQIDATAAFAAAFDAARAEVVAQVFATEAAAGLVDGDAAMQVDAIGGQIVFDALCAGGGDAAVVLFLAQGGRRASQGDVGDLAIGHLHQGVVSAHVQRALADADVAGQSGGA